MGTGAHENFIKLRSCRWWFYNGGSNTVHGEIFLPEETDTYSIQRLNDDCPINTEKGTGLLNFDQTYTNAVYASEEFSRLPPTLLTSEDTLHTLGNPAGNFQIITMNTCKYGRAFYEEQLSYTVNILYGDAAHPIKNQCIHPDDVNLTKRNTLFCPYLDPVDMEREIQHGTSTVDLDEFADAEQSYKPAYCGEVIGITLYQLLLDDVDKA
ncbi:hypothetical protein HPULCUR_004555 [Helicostylum pulchrum]|uniref:Uncharacterized protein n=1 Tax=Helicostylum pulchrum TaxID=562976 RepID=A0ABP9XXU4_9FUNG